jgi:hypothetical protein
LDAAAARLCESSFYDFVQAAWQVVEPGDRVYGASLPTTMMVKVLLSRPLRRPGGSARGVVGSAAGGAVVPSGC